LSFLFEESKQLDPEQEKEKDFKMTEAAAVIPPLNERPIKNTIVLFDVDGTLTPARLVRPASPPLISLKNNH
jgi:hypothetical protein